MCCLRCFRSFDSLISDAPELIQDFLEKEQDASCKRNAFMMLIHVDQVEDYRLLLCVYDCICGVCFIGKGIGLPKHLH